MIFVLYVGSINGSSNGCLPNSKSKLRDIPIFDPFNPPVFSWVKGGETDSKVLIKQAYPNQIIYVCVFTSIPSFDMRIQTKGVSSCIMKAILF